jgi:hypothetical protein
MSAVAGQGNEKIAGHHGVQLPRRSRENAMQDAIELVIPLLALSSAALVAAPLVYLVYVAVAWMAKGLGHRDHSLRHR